MFLCAEYSAWEYNLSKKTSYKIIKFLKYPKKIPAIIRLSKEIMTCNDYLKNYASQFKSEDKIHVIPTSVDTNKFIPKYNDEYETKKRKWKWDGDGTSLKTPVTRRL